MSELHERLREVRKYKKLNQGDFADLVGLGRSTLGMMEVGKREILERHIKSVASICGINEDWLRTGNGDIVADTNVNVIDQLAKEMGLDDFAIRALTAYQKLSPENRAVIKQYIFGICAEYGISIDIKEKKEPKLVIAAMGEGLKVVDAEKAKRDLYSEK